MSKRRRPLPLFRPAPGWQVGLVVLVAIPAAFGLGCWMAGQLLREHHNWSQWLFWLPSWGALLAALCLWGGCRLTMNPVRGRRIAVGVLLVAAAWSGYRFLRYDVGLVPGAHAAAEGEVSLTHWNARSPTWPPITRAKEAADALRGAVSDVNVITGPGQLCHELVRGTWVPSGYQVVDLKLFAVASRHPLLECRMLGARNMRPGNVEAVCAAWIVVRLPSGRPLRILAVDLPSATMFPRGDAADALAALLLESPPPEQPDIVVGDTNSTPEGLVYDAFPGNLHLAPPWRASGWLCTYRRPWALFRIDAMLGGKRAEWRGFRTIDLGWGEHRAQQGVFEVVQDG